MVGVPQLGKLKTIKDQWPPSEAKQKRLERILHNWGKHGSAITLTLVFYIATLQNDKFPLFYITHFVVLCYLKKQIQTVLDL